MTLFDFMTWEWNSADHMGPGMYSYFHIIWLVIMTLLCIGSYFYGKKYHDSKSVDRTILIIDITLIVTEILKQIMYQFSYYKCLRIDVLPFSFCSVPMYIALIGALVKKEKIKNACYTFLAFYGIVGGLCAMFYPVTLNTKFIYISFQTMYWHTMLVTMAVYLIIVKAYGKSYKKEVFPSFCIFLCCSLLAVGLNELTYHTYLEPRQTPVCSIDNNPGSYTYLNYGYEKDGTYYFIKEDGDGFDLTDNYEESIHLYIAYPETDETYSSYNLIFNDKNDVDKYIEISSDKKLVKVDAPSNKWEWSYITSTEAVFSMMIDEEKYCLTYDNDAINVKKFAECDENTIYSRFIDVEVASVGDSADFFFISNHNPTKVPILNLIQPYVPYPVFVLIYISGFFGISSLTWFVCFTIRKTIDSKKKKQSES